MKRPEVKVKSKNIINDLLKHLQKLLPSLKEYEGLFGITLNGGLSRGYADHLSEIDITLFLDSATYKKWSNKNQSALPQAKRPYEGVYNIYELDGVFYDIKYVNLAEEQQIGWEQVTLWDASYAEILYDPKGMISKLYESKLGKHPDIKMIKNSLFACWWYSHLAGNIWIHRGDIPQGHLMLTEAVKSVLQALFIVNNEYIPHEKWVIHMTRSLPWLPENWDKRISQVMTAINESSDDLKRRQEIIKKIHLDVERYLNEDYEPHAFPSMKHKNKYLTNHFS
jgi:hypothetical protein